MPKIAVPWWDPRGIVMNFESGLIPHSPQKVVARWPVHQR
jgi:hypothetical protein